ncbi:MAG: hypothetical protein IJA23_01210 [Clostridia bacterium]|nr:hypothetical protein [Clostridia bacterium]
MKKICSFLLIFIFFNNSQINGNVTFSYEQKTQYAKAVSGCVLYKSVEMKDSYDNVYFFVPESYFVVVLKFVNENCIKVQYDKFIGYVKSKFVKLVNIIPIDKTLDNVKLDIKETSGTQIWNMPTTAGMVLTTIPAGFKEINYISYVVGDIPYGGESNIWYYVTYTPFENSTNVYEGYIYSENATNLDDIIFNVETDPEIQQVSVNENNDSLNLNATLKTIIVALISIPIILFIVVILYKIVKKMQENTNKRINHNNEMIEKYNNSNDMVVDNKNDNLRSKINDMKSQVFVKQNKDLKSKSKYPSFPFYDSDDDLL